MNPIIKGVGIAAAIAAGILVIIAVIGTAVFFTSPLKKLTTEVSPDGKYKADIFYRYTSGNTLTVKTYIRNGHHKTEIMTFNCKGAGYADIAWSPDSTKVAVTAATKNNLRYVKVFDVSKWIYADIQCNNTLLGPVTEDVYPRWKDNSTVAVIVKGQINRKPEERELDAYNVSDAGTALVLSKCSLPVTNPSAQ